MYITSWTFLKNRRPSEVMHFLKIKTGKDCLVKCLKSLVLVHLATVNMLSSLKTCTTALWSYCFTTSAKIELEKFRLTGSEILGVFVNTVTADDKYSLQNRENLLQAIQLQVSKKKKMFSKFFAAYLKSASNFEHFERKDDPHRLCVLEIRDCQRCDSSNI